MGLHVIGQTMRVLSSAGGVTLQSERYTSHGAALSSTPCSHPVEESFLLQEVRSGNVGQGVVILDDSQESVELDNPRPRHPDKRQS